MQYTALYRKLRPRAFASVVGQPHIVRTLTNQLSSGRVSHAYLFCGTRGTGKTSTAKIFARAVNCAHPRDAEACGECPSCKAIDGGYSLNVIEIDAASNNSVDNVRDLREEVKYPPTEGKYKVYIIDEVHMLSTGAFNALLKTLEEPPEHVVFILATTDPQKIPPTVHSRCQRFDFRRITAAAIAETLAGYAAAEGIDISADALGYIARMSDGSMRDALSILDQCTTFYFNQSISLEHVQDIVGAVDDRVFFALTDALYALDGARVMEIIDALSARGRDLGRFVSDFMAHLRNLLVARSVKEPSAALNLSEDAVARLAEQAGDIPGEALMRYIHIFSVLQGQLRYAANVRILLEVCCLRLCNPEADDDGAAALADARLRKLETSLQDLRRVIAKGGAVPAADAKQSARTAGYVPSAANATTDVGTDDAPRRAKPVPGDIAAVCDAWDAFVQTVTQVPLKIYLRKTTPAYLEGEALMLVCDNTAMAAVLKKYAPDIQAALAQRFDRTFELAFLSRDEHNDRHKRLYGAEDEQVVISPEIFTDKLNIDIMIEE